MPLLTRTTRQVTLTPAGLELLPVAQRTVQEISSTLAGLLLHREYAVFGKKKPHV